MQSYQVYKVLENTGILLDIRTTHEHEANGTPNIKNKILHEWKQNNTKLFIQNIEELLPFKSETIFVICARGIRSQYIAQQLEDAKYNNVINVIDGFSGWKKNNLPYTQYKLDNPQKLNNNAELTNDTKEDMKGMLNVTNVINIASNNKEKNKNNIIDKNTSNSIEHNTDKEKITKKIHITNNIKNNINNTEEKYAK